MEPLTLMETLENIKDPRQAWKVGYKLIDVLTITFLALMCGANCYKEIEMFAEGCEDWLRSTAGLEGPLPSRFVIRRVMIAINPTELAASFASWMASSAKVLTGETICLDGKAVRGSGSKSKKNQAVHVVSAFAAQRKLCLAHCFVPEKRNELTGIRELLDALTIKGCIITMDAMGCRSEFAATIKEKGGDYMLALKGNNGNLEDDVKFFFESELGDKRTDYKFDRHETVDSGHGRVETRIYHATDCIDWLPDGSKWAGLKSIWRVENQVFCNGETTSETRYFISSLPANAALNAKHIRNHWGIESYHWILDVGFREDSWKVKCRNAAKNLATLRKFATEVLRSDKDSDCGVAGRRFKAAVNGKYRKRMLEAIYSGNLFM
jgi:predicted transposase YbfD/YdcC